MDIQWIPVWHGGHMPVTIERRNQWEMASNMQLVPWSIWCRINLWYVTLKDSSYYLLPTYACSLCCHLWVNDDELICSLGRLHADFSMPMELHGYVGIQRVWAWAQVVPMDNLVDGQRVGRWVMGWIWTSSTRPKPDPLPSLLISVGENKLYTIVWYGRNKSDRLHNKGPYHKWQYKVTFFRIKILCIQP